MVEITDEQFDDRRYFGTETFDKVYCKLIQVARNRRTINYKEIAEIMGLPERGSYMARETGKILGKISKYEDTHNRPLLSAVVVREDTRIPGEGFFTLARELGELEENMDERTFWRRELKMIYDTWGEKFKSGATFGTTVNSANIISLLLILFLISKVKSGVFPKLRYKHPYNYNI